MRALVVLAAIAVAAVVLVAGGVLFQEEIPDSNSPARTAETGEGTDGFVDFTIKFVVLKTIIVFGIETLTADAVDIDWTETLGTPEGPVTATVFPVLTVSQQCLTRVTMFWADTRDSDSVSRPDKTFTVGGQITVAFGHLYLFPGEVSVTFEIEVKGCGVSLYENYVKIHTQSVGLNFDGVNGS